MVNYLLLVAILSGLWILYATFRLAPTFAKQWKSWGEVFAFLAFMALELAFLEVFLHPT